jgi:hypothetical protein
MTYKNDPRWITAKRWSKCSGKDCDEQIDKGMRAFYYPEGGQIFASTCGHAQAAERDFNSAKFDEEGF